MRRLITSMGACAAFALSGCATEAGDPVASSGATATAAAQASASVTAEVRNTAGQSLAEGTATQVGDSIVIRVNSRGMPLGAYAAHIHGTGVCAPPDFTSAGPHWNPTGQQHGKNNPAGMHKGDLPNLAVGTDGRGSFEFTIPGASLVGGPNPMLDRDGAALVIHAKADDYRSDPAGNAGARMACGVFR